MGNSTSNCWTRSSTPDDVIIPLAHRQLSVYPPWMTEEPEIGAIKAHFTAALPEIQRRAGLYFRHLNPDKREEAVAETIAIAWKQYLRLWERGKDADSLIIPLTTFSARAVRCGRKVAGTKHETKDVMSRVAQQQKEFHVQELPEAGEALESLHDNTVTPPPDQAAFRNDFPLWLERFTPKKREVIEDAALGYSTKELADRHDVSAGRVSQIRHEAKEEWEEFVGR